ncbi:MAG: hypothetical protein PWR02_116 [Synergistales bacterium]|nr:hypothetical protein [Synergistales bacterium]
MALKTGRGKDKITFTRIFHRIVGTGPIADVFSNMAILTSGNIAARAISVVTVPIISRMYTPQDFGALALYASTLSLLAPLTTFRYSMTIPLPRNERSAINLVFLCLAIQFLIAAVVSVFFVFSGERIIAYFSMEPLIPYRWLLPIGVFGIGIYETFSFWATRVKAFTSIAKTKASQAFFSASVKIGFGFLGIRPFGLLLGHLASQIAGLLLLIREFRKADFSFRKTVTVKKMSFLAKRYSKFPKYQIPSRFLLALAVQMPVFFIAATYGTDIAGFFGMAVTIVALPMHLFGQTLSQAYYGEIARMGKSRIGAIRQLSIGLMKRLFFVSVPFFLIFVFFAPDLFRIVLGERWIEAGKFAVFLSFYLLSQFISSPFVHTLNVLEMQSLFFLLNATRVGFLFVLFAICKFFSLPPMYSVAAYSFFLTAHYLFTLFIILRTLYKKERSFVNSFEA